MTVAPDGNSGSGTPNKLGPSPRKLPKNNGPKKLKNRPFGSPVDE